MKKPNPILLCLLILSISGSAVGGMEGVEEYSLPASVQFIVKGEAVIEKCKILRCKTFVRDPKVSRKN